MQSYIVNAMTTKPGGPSRSMTNQQDIIDRLQKLEATMQDAKSLQRGDHEDLQEVCEQLKDIRRTLHGGNGTGEIGLNAQVSKLTEMVYDIRKLIYGLIGLILGAFFMQLISLVLS